MHFFVVYILREHEMISCLFFWQQLFVYVISDLRLVYYMKRMTKL